MIDSHCHLADEVFAADLEAVVARARDAGVEAALCILDATNREERARMARVLGAWPDARCTVGVHPHHAGAFAGRLDDIDQVLLEAVGAHPEMRAIGEIGLDYHYDFAPRAVQREVFRRQARFAVEREVPIVVHTREADDDTVGVLEEAGDGLTGVLHCFTGDAALARRALARGFYVSFSGIVSFRRAEQVRAAARVVPRERLLVETDAPFLAPAPHRGRRNEPAWVGRVVEALAEARGETPEDVARATTASFRALFREPPAGRAATPAARDRAV